MFDVIKDYWLKWLMGIIGTGVVGGFKFLRDKQKEAEAKQKEATARLDSMEKGIQALLRDRIVHSYYHYRKRGDITLHGLESVELMYQEYHNLGGNGTVTKLVSDLKEMDVVDK